MAKAPTPTVKPYQMPKLFFIMERSREQINKVFPIPYVYVNEIKKFVK